MNSLLLQTQDTILRIRKMTRNLERKAKNELPNLLREAATLARISMEEASRIPLDQAERRSAMILNAGTLREGLIRVLRKSVPDFDEGAFREATRPAPRRLSDIAL